MSDNVRHPFKLMSSQTVCNTATGVERLPVPQNVGVARLAAVLIGEGHGVIIALVKVKYIVQVMP